MSDEKVMPHEISHRSRARSRLGDVAVALIFGVGGGVAQAIILNAPILDSVWVGAMFGFLFGLLFSERASTPGAGLIWGFSASVLLWFLASSETNSARLYHPDLGLQLDDVRKRFPELVAYVVCLGMPSGIGLGIRGKLYQDRAKPCFRLPRALVAGGIAGLASGLIFGYWMLVGGFFPLIAGADGLSSQAAKAICQFAVSLLIGMTFGLLFQCDVRGYGSCMGWGLGYAILWWFIGPITFFPILSGNPLNWTTDGAGQLFGGLVGYILYGLILGFVYASLDHLWVRLFIQSDPLNREPEGTGSRLLRSLGWGAMAGIVGGILSSPLMIATQILPHVIGLGIHLSTGGGLLAHLLISIVIGMSYGVLFRDEGSTLAMSTSWGCIFGLIWWYAGPLTLLPLALTGEIDWRASTASILLPSAFAHLVYGGITAAVFYILECRHRRRHIFDPRVAARELRRLRPEGTPAPALWFLALSLGIALPILLR